MPTSRPETLIKLVFAASFAVATGLLEPAGRAADPPSGAAPAPAGPLIIVTVPEIAGSDVDDRAAGTVAAHVREAGAEVRVVRHNAGKLAMRKVLTDAQALSKTWDARGVIWIDIGSGAEAGVYLFERGTSQIYGRRIDAKAAQMSATIESVANIAGSATAELLEGRVVGMAPVAIAAAESPASDKPEAETAAGTGAASGAGTAAGAGTSASPAAGTAATPPPMPAPQPQPTAFPYYPPRPPPRLRPRPPQPSSASSDDLDDDAKWPRLALSAGYTGNTFGGGIPWQSAISLLASWEITRSSWFGLGYDVTFAEHVGDPRFGFEIQRHPIVASGGYRFDIGGLWDFQVGARLTVDFLTLTPGQPPPPPPGFPPPPPPPELTNVVYSVAPLLGIGARITDRIRAGVLGGIDIPVNQPPRVGPGSFPGFDPAPVHFLLAAALQVDVVVPGSAPSSSGGRAAKR